jgi:lipopolysaccharide transport system ATP-binding protein
MMRVEIARKFDEIVEFSGVEKFLDTPVKRYSSGMYLRLAFAVAAHLEPEILVVDEVLAVGDAEFQKKCLGKLNDIASAGRTVLFVSHDLAAISMLCARGIVLDRGKIIHDGSVDKAILTYLGDRLAMKEFRGRKMDIRARVNCVELNSAAAVSLEFEVTLRGALTNPQLGIGIDDAEGRRIATLQTMTAARLPAVAKDQTQTFHVVTEPIRLSPGMLLIKAALADEGQDIEIHEDAIRLVVPDYVPFEIPPQYRQQGPLLVTVQIVPFAGSL